MPRKSSPSKAKKTAKKTPAVKKLAKLAAVKKAFTKTQLESYIGEKVGITKKQVGFVLETLGEVIEAHVKKGAAGSIKLLGLIKVEKAKKPARKARKGVNPFTGEEMVFKAKPAHNVIKVKALKKLKEMID